MVYPSEGGKRGGNLFKWEAYGLVVANALTYYQTVEPELETLQEQRNEPIQKLEYSDYIKKLGDELQHEFTWFDLRYLGDLENEGKAWRVPRQSWSKIYDRLVPVDLKIFDNEL